MKRIILIIGILLVTILLGFFYFIVFGVPLHDLRLWKLEQNYRAANLIHPPSSVFIVAKKYLGGPSEHGDSVCNYIVGELRASSLTKEAIRASYDGHSVAGVASVGNVSLTVRFLDEEESWSLELPWWKWEGELKETYSHATSTLYLISAAVLRQPFLGDLRCDD